MRWVGLERSTDNLTMLPKIFIFVSLLFLNVYASESDVLELTDEDFTDELKRHENALVMFYAPW